MRSTLLLLIGSLLAPLAYADDTGSAVTKPEGSLAFLVNCYPEAYGAAVATNTNMLERLAEDFMHRGESIVLMDNPTANDLRTKLHAFANDGRHYATVHLVLAGIGYGNDMGDSRMACKGFTNAITDIELADAAKSVNPKLRGAARENALAAAIESARERERARDSIALDEIESALLGTTNELVTFLDASRRGTLPNADIGTLGPVAADSRAAFAMSAAEQRNFAPEGFLELLEETLAKEPGTITAGGLVVTMRRESGNPLITISVKTKVGFDLGTKIIAPKVEKPEVAPAVVAKKHRSLVLPAASLGAGVACGIGSIASYVRASELYGMFTPDTNMSETEWNDTVAEFKAADTATWAFGMCGVAFTAMSVGTFVLLPTPTGLVVHGAF